MEEWNDGRSTGVPHEIDFSVMLALVDFTKNLKPLPTSSGLWDGRKNPSPMDDAKLSLCKSGELCWVAAVYRPEICARSARIASRINALCASDTYCINELVRAVTSGSMRRC